MDHRTDITLQISHKSSEISNQIAIQKCTKRQLLLIPQDFIAKLVASWELRGLLFL